MDFQFQYQLEATIYILAQVFFKKVDYVLKLDGEIQHLLYS